MTAWIGPVQLVDAFYEPQITWTGVPTAQGLQAGQITGQAEWWQAHQLRELVNNPARRVTIGGQTGVLEPIYFTDDLLGPLVAWCLLQSFQLGQADQTHSLQGTTGLVPYTLTLASVGDGTQRQTVIVRSARAKANDYGLTAHSIVVDPFADDFAKSPGGTKATREYDTVHPRDLTVPSSTSGLVTFYDGTVTPTDQLASVVLPQLPNDALGAPPWITARGRDCRGIDRREEREVYGPSHPTKITSDLGITNGLVSFWVGNKGLAPYLNLQAFSSGSWHEEGCVVLNTTKSLLGARLIKVTPDETKIALLVQDFGEAFVTLKRGERMLRFATPAGLVPTWSGTPPTTRAVAALNWTGNFGQGLDGGGSTAGTWAAPYPTWSGDSRYSWSGTRTAADFRLRWPASVKIEGSTSFWYRADRPSSSLSAGAGFLSIFDSGGGWVGQVWLDSSGRMNFKMGSHTAQTTAITFAAGDMLMLTARWSATHGIGVSVRLANSTLVSAYDATATTPGTNAPYDIAYFVNFSKWGDGNWGDGNWGGVTLYPEGSVDNHQLFRRWITDAEVATLATATYGLDKLPDPQGDLIWYAPYDVAPIVSLPAMSGGRAVDPVTDPWGNQKAIAAVTGDLTDTVALLARSEPFGGATDQQDQAAAEFEQRVRVR